jgi:hypothetical protein
MDKEKPGGRSQCRVRLLVADGGLASDGPSPMMVCVHQSPQDPAGGHLPSPACFSLSVYHPTMLLGQNPSNSSIYTYSFCFVFFFKKRKTAARGYGRNHCTSRPPTDSPQSPDMWVPSKSGPSCRAQYGMGAPTSKHPRSFLRSVPSRPRRVPFPSPPLLEREIRSPIRARASESGSNRAYNPLGPRISSSAPLTDRRFLQKRESRTAVGGSPPRMMGAEKFGLGMEPDEEEVELTTPTVTTPRKMRSLDFQHIGSLAAVAESLSPGSRWRRALTSLRVVIFQAKINVLLPFGPLAVLLHHLTGNHVSFLLRSRIGSYLATLLT